MKKIILALLFLLCIGFANATTILNDCGTLQNNTQYILNITDIDTNNYPDYCYTLSGLENVDIQVNMFNLSYPHYPMPRIHTIFLIENSNNITIHDGTLTFPDSTPEDRLTFFYISFFVTNSNNLYFNNLYLNHYDKAYEMTDVTNVTIRNNYIFAPDGASNGDIVITNGYNLKFINVSINSDVTGFYLQNTPMASFEYCHNGNKIWQGIYALSYSFYADTPLDVDNSVGNTGWFPLKNADMAIGGTDNAFYNETSGYRVIDDFTVEVEPEHKYWYNNKKSKDYGPNPIQSEIKGGTSLRTRMLMAQQEAESNQITGFSVSNFSVKNMTIQQKSIILILIIALIIGIYAYTQTKRKRK